MARRQKGLEGEVLTNPCDLSVVVAVFNEEDGIAAAIVDIQRYVLDLVTNSELLIIDDGSTDKTREILEQMRAADPRIILVPQENCGQGPALFAGLCRTRGAAVLLLDGDRQIGLEDFVSHWRCFRDERLHALLGFRAPRRDPRHRRILSRLLRLWIWALFGQAPADAGVPYKIVSREVWLNALQFISQSTRFPSILLAVYMIRLRPFETREIAVTHLERRSGRSHVVGIKLFRLSVQALAEILAFRLSLLSSRAA